MKNTSYFEHGQRSWVWQIPPAWSWKPLIVSSGPVTHSLCSEDIIITLGLSSQSKVLTQVKPKWIFFISSRLKLLMVSLNGSSERSPPGLPIRPPPNTCISCWKEGGSICTDAIDTRVKVTLCFRQDGLLQQVSEHFANNDDSTINFVHVRKEWCVNERKHC